MKHSTAGIRILDTSATRQFLLRRLLFRCKSSSAGLRKATCGIEEVYEQSYACKESRRREQSLQVRCVQESLIITIINQFSRLAGKKQDFRNRHSFSTFPP